MAYVVLWGALRLSPSYSLKHEILKKRDIFLPIVSRTMPGTEELLHKYLVKE